MEPNTKRCPYCDEIIRENAIKCRHCGTLLTDAPVSGAMSGITLVKQALASRYELQEELGRGGMATVYRAVQKNLNRPVALKVIHQNLVHDSEFLARFHREAQVCASLQHNHIVTVYDEGELNGIHFMAMELLEGFDLHQLIRRQGKLTVEQTLVWITPIATALEYAHSRGIIHRDIKSSNILVTRDGRPVLMDFGIAHAASGTRLTQTGLVIGTPEYMSPEQAEGKTIDRRTDIYSLGIVLYECLTGQLPFKADNPLSIIMKVVNEAAVPPVSLDNKIPEWLNSLVLTCLAKRPEERFGNALELAHALEKTQQPSSHASLKPLEKTPKSPSEYSKQGKKSGMPPQKPKKRGSGLKVFAWLLFIALLIFGGMYGYQYYEKERETYAYNFALISNSTWECTEYLNCFPNGMYKYEINQKLEVLREQERLEEKRKAKKEEERKIEEAFLTTSSGAFSDHRDGQTYKWIRIGKQVWMAENLNYVTQSNSWCCNDHTNNSCKSGRAYTWDVANEACPTGWKLPSRDDWLELVNFLGGAELAGKRLKSKIGWSDNYFGTDDFGFSALPGCRYGKRNGKWGLEPMRYHYGLFSHWRSSDGFNNGAYYPFVIHQYRGEMGNIEMETALPIRCIKNIAL